MEQKPCIFCQIVAKRIPAKVVYEDENSIAFLDIHPRSKGMCIIVPKQHYVEFDENIELSAAVTQSALIVAEMVKKGLEPQSISLSIMSSAIPHFNVRVYPVYENQIPLIENQPIEVDERELDEIAEKIRKIKIVIRKPEVKEEPKKKVEERKRTEEEVKNIRRETELA